MNRASISAIVLAGGQSMRMGRDKASLPFGSETLLSRSIKLASSVSDDVVVVARSQQTVPPGGRVVRDQTEGAGPLAALALGLGAVCADRAWLLACDAPLVQTPLLTLLLDRLGDADAAVPLISGTPMTTCAVYRTRILPAARQVLRTTTPSLRALLDAVTVRWILEDEARRADPDLRSFLDCDTPEDYRAALRLADLE